MIAIAPEGSTGIYRTMVWTDLRMDRAPWTYGLRERSAPSQRDPQTKECNLFKPPGERAVFQ